MNAPRVVAAVIALSAVVLGGCKSKAPAPAPAAANKASAAAPAAGGKASSANAASSAGVAPAANPMPAPAARAAAAGPADSRMGGLVQERQVLNEKREQLVKSYSEMGDKAYAESRFEDADLAYGNVLDLDPTNQNAQRRREEIGAILGKTPMNERNAFNQSVEAYKVRTQQAKVEVANLSSQAQARAKNGDYDAATALYDKALVIAGLYPDNVDFSPSVAGLKGLRDGAKKSAEAANEGKRRTILKEAGDQAAVEAAKQREQRRQRVRTLFDKANQAMERNDYQVARNLSEEILASDPTNEAAKRLRRIALDASNDALDDSYHHTILDEWKHVFEQLADAYMPQSDDYSFPTSWEEVQGKRSAPLLSTSKNMAEDPQNREVRNRLEATRTTVQFNETRIDGDGGALDYLHRISGVNIILLPAAKEGKSDTDLTIEKLTLDQPVSVSQILTLITGLKTLAWNIENGVVQITTPQAAQGAFIVQLYDVKDLATPISNFPGDEINLDPKGEHAEKEEAKEPVAEFVLDNIGELITNNVDKPVWEGGGSVEAVPPGTLVIKCPAATHAKVQQLLDGLRGAGGLQVAIETRFITVQDNFLQEVGVDLRGLGDQSGGLGVAGQGGVKIGAVTSPITFDDVFFGGASNPAGVGTGADTGIFYQIQGGNKGSDIRSRFENLYDVALGRPGVLTNSGGLSFEGTLIDKTQLEVILRAVEKSDRSTVVTAPRLTAYNGQRANVTVLNQQSYISDFDVEVAQAAQIGDPIVQVIRDGVILDLRPVVSADRRFITMELRPTVAVLTRPIQTFVTSLAQGPPVTIQLPNLEIQRVRTTVTMPDGGTLLLGGLKFFTEQRLDSSVPFLNKIPLVSFLISRKGTYLEKRNLLVLIRARIIRPEENEPGSGRKM